MKVNYAGRTLLNARVNHFDGRRPDPNHRWYEQATNPSWTVVRHAPRKRMWARSTHGSAKVSHRVDYQLVATHVSGVKVKVTVWKCGARSHSEVQVGPRPNRLRDRCPQCSRIP